MPTDLRAALWLSAMVGLLLSTCIGRSETDPQRVYQRALPSVMTLEVENTAGENFIGAAILALADDTAITAWHVVADARAVWAVFADGSRVRVLGCIDKDWRRDLALLKLERSLRGRKAALSRDLMQVGSRAYVIGAPKGLAFSIADGLVSQVRTVDGFAQYQVSCPISPGNSGGPLLNFRGQVTGIVSWTKTDAQNISFVVPCQELQRLNPLAPLVRWDHARQPSPDEAPPRRLETGSHWMWRPADPRAGEFGHFAMDLERLVGKEVTVVLRNNGRENKYTFSVPPRSGQ